MGQEPEEWAAEWAARTFQVTPALYLGQPPSDVATVPVGSAVEALDVIRAGGVAVLPCDRWDLASEALELLGESKAWRLSELLWLQHGVKVLTDGLTEDELNAGLLGATTSTAQGGVFCEGCGYFEAVTLAERFGTPGRSGRERCPVCHGKGLPLLCTEDRD